MNYLNLFFITDVVFCDIFGLENTKVGGKMKKLLFVTVKVVIFLVVWEMLAAVIDLPFSNPAVWRFGAELIPLVILIILSIIFTQIDKDNIRIPIFSGFSRGMANGFLIGIIWFGVCELILSMTGIFNVYNVNKVSMLWLWIISAFLNVVIQELLVRGYIYQLIKKNYNKSSAVIVTTAVFTLLHGEALEAGIIAVLNIITTSILMTLLMEESGSLAAPIAAHSLWNILGGVFFGCISLGDDYPALMKTIFLGEKYITGGSAGMEGSIIVLFANVLLLSADLIIKYRPEIIYLNKSLVSANAYNK